MNFLEHLFNYVTVALVIGGILILFFGVLAAISKEKRSLKWIALGSFLAGMIVLSAGLLSEYKGQQASKLLQSKTEEVAKIAQEIARLAKTNANLNKEIAGSLTGGDSFCYLMPIPSFTEADTLALNLHHFGKYPMYDVHIEIWDDTINENVDLGKIFEKHFGYGQKKYTVEEYLSRSKEKRDEESKKNAVLNKEIMEIINRAKLIDKSIGTITLDVNRQGVTIYIFNLPPDRDHQEFSAHIHARNGYFLQKIKFKVVDGRWRMNSTLLKSISEKENVLLRELRSVGDTLTAEIVK
jgi:cell division protein FtsB